MKKAIAVIGPVNIFLLIGYLILWGIVLFGHGLISVAIWAALKLVLPVFGAALFIVGLAVCIVKRKRPSIKPFISIFASLLFLFPFLLTANVITMAYPANINKVNPSVTVSWPLAEETFVAWGGDRIESNLPHAAWGSERWAYDLVMEPYNTGDSKLQSYGIWDKELLSPVAGTVIAVKDQEEDIPPNTEDFKSLEGNYVYIEIEKTGTYLLMNHLKQGSVAVSVGDRVQPGDLLGRIGNSGATSEPHLHIHHQRQNPTKVWHPLLAEGLPLYFDTVEGTPMPVSGMRVDPKRH